MVPQCIVELLFLTGPDLKYLSMRRLKVGGREVTTVDGCVCEIYFFFVVLLIFSSISFIVKPSEVGIQT